MNENKITATRTAIKDASHFGKAGTYHADIDVTSFTAEDGDESRILSGSVRSPIGSISLRHQIREHHVWASASFHEDNWRSGVTEVYTTSSHAFKSQYKSTMAVTVRQCDQVDTAYANGSEFSMFLDPKTAREMAEAILAQLDADEGVQA